ncbi:hypothetical protein JOD43_000565 [Pullulanibacillus pueri]|nr:hypothetical protein [Pullulanibacillus pueri]
MHLLSTKLPLAGFSTFPKYLSGVAGFHRASPSTSLDKSNTLKIQFIICETIANQFLIVNRC